jgi:hypothetical protein
MTLTSTGSKCDWCGRSFDGNDKPCSAASEAERRVTAGTTTDKTCKLELRERGY